MDKKRTMQRRRNNNKVTYRVFVLIKYEDKLENFYKEEALASYPHVRALEDMINRVKEHAIDAKKRGLGLEFHISEEYGQAFRDIKFSKNYSADELSLLDLEKSLMLVRMFLCMTLLTLLAGVVGFIILHIQVRLRELRNILRGQEWTAILQSLSPIIATP